jgi:hypothetical protein
MAADADRIAAVVDRVQQQVPKLAKLKLVFGVELTSGGLMGPAKSDRFSVELPGPKVSEGSADDERIQLSMPRTMFDVLAAEGQLVDWREAFIYGHLKVAGDSRVKRLLGQAIGGV